MTQIYKSTELNDSFLAKLKEELSERFSGCKKIVVKMHFGEPGNKAAFTLPDVKPIFDVLDGMGFDVTFYETSVAYGSPRSTSDGHQQVAIEKGYDHHGEIVIDGEFVTVKKDDMAYEVGKELGDADAVLVISHLKGHCCAGFGGAIKNLGMGALSKKTKGMIHAGGMPEYVGGCVQCGTCEKMCPIGGIKVTDKPEFITCYGCSNCVYVCPENAIKVKKQYFDVLLAEGALAAQDTFKKYYYVTMVKRIAKECDCEKDCKEMIGPDIGWIMGPDGVALDKCAHDLIVVKAGKDVFLEKNKKSGLQQVEAGEKLGMGKQEYEFTEL